MKKKPLLFMLGKNWKKKLHNFLEFFAKVYRFANFKNSKIFLVAISPKLIINFKMNLKKKEEGLQSNSFLS